jgi:hypothetical protein
METDQGYLQSEKSKLNEQADAAYQGEERQAVRNAALMAGHAVTPFQVMVNGQKMWRWRCVCRETGSPRKGGEVCRREGFRHLWKVIH